MSVSRALTKQEGSMAMPLNKDANDTLLQLRELLGNSSDFQSSAIQIGTSHGFLCTLTSMADAQSLMEKLHEPLKGSAASQLSVDSLQQLEQFRQEKLGVLAFAYAATVQEAAGQLLSGDALLIVDGVEQVLCITVGGMPTRAIEAPKNQKVIRGMQESFTESLETNISLIRRRLRNPLLRFESFMAGEETKTCISLAYLANAAEESLVSEFRLRLTNMRVKAIYDSSNVEEIISQNRSWFFPTLLSLERPDTAASALVEGKCVVIVDGSPFVLIGPAVYGNFFQSAGDYYVMPVLAMFMRLMRHVSLILSLFLPALYISVIYYHSEMVPTLLLYSISGQEQGSPFTTGVALVAMTLLFELLREAGTRVPSVLGQAVPIAGAIVLGQAAVEAGIVSSILLIVVAATELCGLLVPHYDFSSTVRLIRFGLLLLGAVLGVYGIFIGIALLTVHLVSLQSFGVPYLTPVAPMRPKAHRDMVFRAPLKNEDAS
ncbi:spore germination protein [Paenibacillus sp. MMS18-CY102]|uniref:spore germination protein n=1 Tax=Paenibacillus sp. MMS18-CY102 TaxID=2682849 RepID=UPI0013654CCF|nr:spore germination protein [Paenibacillus sp. MMS18-CY102]MWC30824.1 spore germination protein [Paenibacillus sp. MMS18-CY102]